MVFTKFFRLRNEECFSSSIYRVSWWVLITFDSKFWFHSKCHLYFNCDLDFDAFALCYFIRMLLSKWFICGFHLCRVHFFLLSKKMWKANCQNQTKNQHYIFILISRFAFIWIFVMVTHLNPFECPNGQWINLQWESCRKNMFVILIWITCFAYARNISQKMHCNRQLFCKFYIPLHLYVWQLGWGNCLDHVKTKLMKIVNTQIFAMQI